MIKTLKMLEAEQRLGRPLEKAMTDALTTEGSIPRAARALDINQNTFYNWMLRLKIQVRKLATVA